jgi:hypothetical protein
MAVKKYRSNNSRINLINIDSNTDRNTGLVLNKTLSPGCEFLMVLLMLFKSPLD